MATRVRYNDANETVVDALTKVHVARAGPAKLGIK
jgi:hypothetical protein